MTSCNVFCFLFFLLNSKLKNKTLRIININCNIIFFPISKHSRKNKFRNSLSILCEFSIHLRHSKNVILRSLDIKILHLLNN